MFHVKQPGLLSLAETSVDGMFHVKQTSLSVDIWFHVEHGLLNVGPLSS